MPDRPRSGFLVNHLLGRYSLRRSFWVHTLLFGWLFAFATAYLSARLVDAYPARYSSMAVLLSVPLAVIVWGWSSAGAFASALRRMFRGEGWFWSLVVMLIVVVGLRQTVDELRELRPFIQENLLVALGSQPGEPFTVTLVDNGRTVEFSGGVNDGAAAALRDVIRPAPKVTTVRLHSPGGWMHEGVRMAEVIRYFNLNTHVKGECASACTVAFLAGLDRTAAPGATIGFHSARPVGGVLSSQRSDRRHESAIYLEAGLERAFVARILATPSYDIWEPTHQELLRGKVLTR